MKIFQTFFQEFFQARHPQILPASTRARGNPDYALAQIDLMRRYVEDGQDGPLWAAEMIGLRGRWIRAGQSGFETMTVFLDQVHDDLINYGECDDAREPGEYDHDQIREVMRGRLAEAERRGLLD